MRHERVNGRKDKRRSGLRVEVPSVFLAHDPTRQAARKIARDGEFATISQRYGGEPRKARRGIAMIRARKTWRAVLEQLKIKMARKAA